MTNSSKVTENDKLRLHKRISYVKSALRILGGLAFIHGSLTSSKDLWITGSVLFILAEIGGVLEEIYGA